MPLYHGTSAQSAFNIASQQHIRPSKDGYFYCFDSKYPESMAGALCFATGDGPRNGSIAENNFFSKYAQLNPDFPKGIRGVFCKIALRYIAAKWAKSQMNSKNAPLERMPAIIVFADNPHSIERTRAGFVRESMIAAKDIQNLTIERVYFDAAALALPEISSFRKSGINIHPIQELIDHVKQQLSR